MTFLKVMLWERPTVSRDCRPCQRPGDSSMVCSGSSALKHHRSDFSAWCVDAKWLELHQVWSEIMQRSKNKLTEDLEKPWTCRGQLLAYRYVQIGFTLPNFSLSNVSFGLVISRPLPFAVCQIATLIGWLTPAAIGQIFLQKHRQGYGLWKVNCRMSAKMSQKT